MEKIKKIPLSELCEKDNRVFIISWEVWFTNIFGYVNKEIVKYFTYLILVIH